MEGEGFASLTPEPRDKGLGRHRPLARLYAPLSYASAPGTSGNYVSTPDAASLDITGDLQLAIHVAMTDWTPSTEARLVSKFQTANQLSWVWGVTSTGALVLYLSANGSTTAARTTSTSVGAADGTAVWLKTTWRASDGRIQAFRAPSEPNLPSAWTQLGTDLTYAIGSLFSSTSQLEFAASTAGTAQPANCKIYRAIVWNGIDGTIVADFNPNQYVTGSSFVSVDGRTYTLNGTASIVSA